MATSHHQANRLRLRASLRLHRHQDHRPMNYLWW